MDEFELFVQGFIIFYFWGKSKLIFIKCRSKISTIDYYFISFIYYLRLFYFNAPATYIHDLFLSFKETLQFREKTKLKYIFEKKQLLKLEVFWNCFGLSNRFTSIIENITDFLLFGALFSFSKLSFGFIWYWNKTWKLFLFRYQIRI